MWVAQGVTQGPSSRHDGDLVHRVGIGHRVPDEGVPCLVIGDELSFLVGHDLGLALGAGDHPVDRLFELGHRDFLLVPPSREKGGLVDQVGQVGPGETGGAAGENF